MIKALSPGLLLLAIGGYMVLGPVLLPRSFFGELGHGDGFGLVGMMVVGAPIFAVGVIATIAGVARRNANDRWGGGER